MDGQKVPRNSQRCYMYQNVRKVPYPFDLKASKSMQKYDTKNDPKTYNVLHTYEQCTRTCSTEKQDS